MKEKAAIRHILNSIYTPDHTKIPHDALNTAIVALNEVQQYHKLGSLEELKERMTPKEVVPFDSSLDPEDMQIIECPKCSRVYWMEDWGFFNFCPNCGQAIDIKEKKK